MNELLRTRHAFLPRLLYSLVATLALVAVALCAGSVGAAVVVFANRDTASVRFTLHDAPGNERRMLLTAGEVALLPVGAQTQVSWNLLQKPAFQQLVPYSIYCFVPGQKEGVNLRQVELTMPQLPQPVGSATSQVRKSVPVKLLVDQNETAPRAVWENRLRRRVADANAILMRQGGLPLNVVACDVWQSNNSLLELDSQSRDFERRVDPGAARIAIGFSSNFPTPRGRSHLGGTRGPLSHHILLREWPRRVGEAEATELLVHELGHFFGAAHSVEANSVMRPILADRQARMKQFRVQFDPLNALVMGILTEQMPDGGKMQFEDLDAPTRARLAVVYAELKKLMPGDPSVQGLLYRLSLIQRIRGS